LLFNLKCLDLNEEKYSERDEKAQESEQTAVTDLKSFSSYFISFKIQTTVPRLKSQDTLQVPL
jgi:hypothetical protein